SAQSALAATEEADESAQSALAATEAADESAQSALAAFTLPAVIKDAGEGTAAVGDDDTAGMDVPRACWLSRRSCITSTWPRAGKLARNSSVKGSCATTRSLVK